MEASSGGVFTSATRRSIPETTDPEGLAESECGHSNRMIGRTACIR
jgi:hypothetical protein